MKNYKVKQVSFRSDVGDNYVVDVGELFTAQQVQTRRKDLAKFCKSMSPKKFTKPLLVSVSVDGKVVGQAVVAFPKRGEL